MRTILIYMWISLRCQDFYHCFKCILSSFIGVSVYNVELYFIFPYFLYVNILTMSRFLSLILMHFVEFYLYQCWIILNFPISYRTILCAMSKFLCLFNALWWVSSVSLFIMQFVQFYNFPMRATRFLSALRYVTDTLFIWEHENRTP